MAKQSFAEIFQQWESNHDEEKAMERRAREGDVRHADGPSINQVRKMDAQDELDLHEMRLEDALEATGSFLDRSHSRGLRKVRIITGKGIHSNKGEAVLRPAVIDLCRSHSKVREVTVPKASEGGSGALSVILKAR